MVVCRDALCSKEINEEKREPTSDFWAFFQPGLAAS